MTASLRKIEKIIESNAGSRRFDQHYRANLNPFVLLEDFHYRGTGTPGRTQPVELKTGIDTVTYLLYGNMAYTGGTAETGILTAGGCRWLENMSYGFLQETPVSRGEYWSVHISFTTDPESCQNGPRSIIIPPEDIPVHRGEDGVITRVIAGEYEGISGPGGRLPEECLFLDISIPPLTPFQVEIPEEYRVLAACMEGQDLHDLSEGFAIEEGSTLLYTRGKRIILSTGTDEARILLLGAVPR